MADTRGRRTWREEEKRGRRGGRRRKKKKSCTHRADILEILGFMQRADLTVEQRKINRKKKKSGSAALEPERPQQGGVQEGFQGATLTVAL